MVQQMNECFKMKGVVVFHHHAILLLLIEKAVQHRKRTIIFVNKYWMMKYVNFIFLVRASTIMASHIIKRSRGIYFRSIFLPVRHGKLAKHMSKSKNTFAYNFVFRLFEKESICSSKCI